MSSVEHYILGLDGPQRAISSFLHQHIKFKHELVSKIQWKIPTYYQRHLICYLNPIKRNGIELAFFRGTKLSNEQGLLAHKGRKLVAGIDIYNVEEIELELIDQIINEALILDQLAK